MSTVMKICKLSHVAVPIPALLSMYPKGAIDSRILQRRMAPYTTPKY